MAYIRCNSGSQKVIEELTAGGAPSAHYGLFDLPNTHKFSKLKILSYPYEASLYTGYPKVRIDGVDVASKPAVNTEFDIKGKNLKLVTCTTNMGYVYSGVKFELS